MALIEVKKGYVQKTINELEYTADYVSSEIARTEESTGLPGMTGKLSKMCDETLTKKKELIEYIERLENYFLDVNRKIDEYEKSKT